MFVVCCVGSGLCDELITRTEEFCRLCVSNCVLSRNLNNEAALTCVGLLRHIKIYSLIEKSGYPHLKIY